MGSDSKFFLYDGKTGDTVAEFTDNPHKGSIVSLFIYLRRSIRMFCFVIEDFVAV